MRRLLLSLAALAVAGPLIATAGEALADPGDGRERGRGRTERESRGWERRQQPPRVERRLPPPRQMPAAPPPREAPPGWRRGATLPPAYRGERVYAYERHRLRPPPAGYAWYRVGDDFLLTQMTSGLVVEVVRD